MAAAYWRLALCARAMRATVGRERRGKAEVRREEERRLQAVASAVLGEERWPRFQQQLEKARQQRDTARDLLDLTGSKARAESVGGGLWQESFSEEERQAIRRREGELSSGSLR